MAGALANLRVLELARSVAAPFCTKLLAGCGAVGIDTPPSSGKSPQVGPASPQPAPPSQTVTPSRAAQEPARGLKELKLELLDDDLFVPCGSSVVLETHRGRVVRITLAPGAGAAQQQITPSPTNTVTPTAVPANPPSPAPVAVSINVQAGPGQLLVFRLEGSDFLTGGLEVVEAHPPFCAYQHVHGAEIKSVLPGPDGRFITRTEFLGECGFGPPNFYIIKDPR